MAASASHAFRGSATPFVPGEWGFAADSVAAAAAVDDAGVAAAVGSRLANEGPPLERPSLIEWFLLAKSELI